MDPAVLAKQARSGHYGLPGMRERAKLVGGSLTVWSEVDAGTEVELQFPPRPYIRGAEGVPGSYEQSPGTVGSSSAAVVRST